MCSSQFCGAFPSERESSRGTCKAVISSHGVHHSHSGSASVIFSPAASRCAHFLFPKAGDKYPTLAEVIIKPIKKIRTLRRFTTHRHLFMLVGEREMKTNSAATIGAFLSTGVPTCHPVCMGMQTEDTLFCCLGLLRFSSEH